MYYCTVERQIKDQMSEHRYMASIYEEAAKERRRLAADLAKRNVPRNYDPSKPVNGHLEPMEQSTAGYDR